jgi:PKD repeat protein
MMRALIQFLGFLGFAFISVPSAFAGSLSLAWDAVSDPRLVGYKVYYGTSSRNYTGQIDVGNTTIRTVSNLTDGATYYFAVTAYDGSRVESGYSNEVVGTVPGGVPVANFTVSTTSGPAPLSLNFTSTSTGSITTYAWVFGDGTTSSVQNPAKTYSSAGSYTVSLTVTGPGGTNTKSVPGYITVTAPADTTPPTAPGSLVATPSSSTAVNLSWTASTDNVGVTGYRVERCTGASCTGFTQIATPAGTTYSDSGRTASTTYRYRVRAVDAAGNLGAYSPIATVATPATADTSPPTAPTGLTVAGSTSTTVSLGWTASTDNVGVTGYRVERCTGASCTSFAQVGTPTGTTYVDSGRAPSTTYRYRVRATDAAGNLSSYSTIVSATTTALPLPRDADFDANGDTDLVWRHAGLGTTSLWLMNNGAKQSGADLLADANWVATRAGDFDGDGRSDLIWRNNVTGAVAMWLMSGTTLVNGATLLTDWRWQVTHVGDFNGDGKDDLVWRNSVSGETSLWIMNGTTFVSGATLLTDVAWVVAQVGDFDGNGKDDLLWRNTSTGAANIWLMNGTQMASGANVLATPGWLPILVGDFDGDGRDDLVWSNAATGETNLWLMNGLVRAAGAALLVNPDWDATHVGDFDGDGRADLIWRNSVTGTTSLWLMNGLARVQGVNLITDSAWAATQVGDYNGDGKSDLAWRNSATGATALWLMNGGVALSTSTLLSDPGWSLVPLR